MKTIQYLFIVFILFLFSSCSKTESILPIDTTSKMESIPKDVEVILPQSTYISSIDNLMPNGGGVNTTDFESKTDQWVIKSGKGEIRTSIYWSGYYQHIEARYQFSLISPKPIQKEGTGWIWWKLTFKYSSTTEVKIAVKYSDNCTYVICTLPIQPKPDYYTIEFPSPRVDYLKWYNNALKSGEFNIDEVNLY
jgi:hypothetical protein